MGSNPWSQSCESWRECLELKQSTPECSGPQRAVRVALWESFIGRRFLISDQGLST
jgi:hypothetical protein